MRDGNSAPPVPAGERGSTQDDAGPNGRGVPIIAHRAASAIRPLAASADVMAWLRKTAAGNCCPACGSPETVNDVVFIYGNAAGHRVVYVLCLACLLAVNRTGTQGAAVLRAVELEFERVPVDGRFYRRGRRDQ